MKKSRKGWFLTALILFVGSIACFCISSLCEDSPGNVVRKLLSFSEKNAGIGINEPIDEDDYIVLDEFKADNLEKIELNLEVGGIVVRPTLSETCRILIDKDDDEDNIQVQRDDNKVKVKDKSDVNVFIFNFLVINDGYTLVVELPQKQYKSLECDVEAGQILIGDVQAEKITADIEVGQIDMKEAKAETLETDIEVGEIIFEGISATDMSADIEIGAIRVSLPEEPNKYYINADTELGDTDVPYESQYISEEAIYKITLNCEIGDIDVVCENTSK